MEMRCYRKILLISYKDHVTNEEVRTKIQQAIRPREDLTIVWRCKLQWYGHISCSSGLAKTILQGTVKGGRRRGRQGKRWEDNTREWTEGSGEQGKMEKTGCKIICGAPATLALKGLVMMMMMMIVGTPKMISQPVSSVFPCSPLPSGTWPTPGLSIP